MCCEPGAYYAYLWDNKLRAYFTLAERGHLLATNLHADTLEQAQAQICGDNRVPAAAFQSIHLLLFLRLHGGWFGKREIIQVWESDGTTAHHLVFETSQLDLKSSRWVNQVQWDQAASWLDHIINSGTRTIQQVRSELMNMWGAQP